MLDCFQEGDLKHWWLWLLILLQPMMYINGLKGDFVFDDQFLIVETMGERTLQSIWSSGLWQEASNQANFYRPLFSTTIWFDQQFFGLESLGYHVHSLMWHTFNILLFASFSSRIMPQRESIAATWVFGCHPLMSELIFWIAARNDTMAMTFALLFLNLFWQEKIHEKKHNCSWKTISILSGVFFAGLLSKESVLILFVPVGWYAFKHRTVRLFAIMVVIVGLLFAWRAHIGIVPPDADQDNIRLVWDKCTVMGIDGLGRVIFPWRLSPATPLTWLVVSWWQGILALGATVLLTLALRQKEWRIWVVWFVGSLALTVPAILYTGNYGDRYWAMSLIAWSLIYAKVIPERFYWLPLPFWTLMIFFRGNAWQSDLDFWEQEVLLNPTPYSHVSLAIIQYNAGDSKRAMENFYTGFQSEPPHLDGCVPFVSSVLSVQGRQSALEASYWAVSRGCEESGEMMGLRAVVLAGMGRWKEVEKMVTGERYDSTRRMDVVRLAVQARNEDWNSFCVELETWSDFDRLFSQLAVLSPSTFENRIEIQNKCSNNLKE